MVHNETLHDESCKALAKFEQGFIKIICFSYMTCHVYIPTIQKFPPDKIKKFRILTASATEKKT